MKKRMLITCLAQSLALCKYLKLLLSTEGPKERNIPFCVKNTLVISIAAFVFQVTDLLRYNSHIIQLTHLKCQWFFVYSQSCVIITPVNFRTFSLPQKEIPYPLTTISQSRHSSQVQATSNLLFNSIDLPVWDISYELSNKISFFESFFYLSKCFQGSSMLQSISGLYSFLRLNNILLYRCSTFCLSIATFPW